MRKIFIITLMFVITIFGANYIIDKTLFNKDIKNKTIERTLSGAEEKYAITEESIEAEGKEIKEKISNIRNRYAIKGLIKTGDTYLENRQLLLALKTYLLAIKENPNDTLLLQKIGDTYFEMNKYNSAYNSYKEIIGKKESNPEKITRAYIYSLPLSGTGTIDLQKIQGEISSFGLTPEHTFFYKTSIECLTDTQGCQNKFQEYIKQGKGAKNVQIGYVKKAFDDYEILQVKSSYFKDTQFISALFQDELYPISNILGEKLLKEKPGYLPVLKMVAKGYFDLGNYEAAKRHLLEYNKVDSDDVKVNYMLGIINIKLHEYILSNIYFVKALKGGYQPQSTITRRLIYNYYLVEDFQRMLLEFKNLIDNSKDVNETDYNLGIYYSLITGNKLQANKWVNKALDLYPKNDNFYGYKGWIYKEANDFASAEEYLKKGFTINKHNPLINLNLGIVEAEKGDYIKAKIYLRNTIGEDPKGEFGELASQKLAEIKLEQEQLQEQIDDRLGL